jgi:hypothetical protein
VLGAVFTGCSTLSELATLHTVRFALDHVDGVRIAGVRIDGERRWVDLQPSELSALTAAALERRVPLDLVLHVRAENPAENTVSARLVDLDWKLFIGERETVSGKLPGSHLLPPGQPVDVPVGASLDLVQFFSGGARELFDVARAIAGGGGPTQDIRLEAMPTIQTSLGPIRYPAPIVIRRASTP